MLYPTLELVFRHRWRYLVLLVVLPLLGAMACIPLFPKATASELIWVQDQNLLSSTLPNYEAYLTPAELAQGDFEQYIQTQAFSTRVTKELRSKSVSAGVATSLAGDLGSDLVANPAGNNLLQLDYSCTRPALCTQVLTTSWDVYEAYATATVNSQLEVAERAYQKQLDQAQAQLGTANAAVTSYLAQHPGENPQTSTDPTLVGLLQAVDTAQQAVTDAKTNLAAAQIQASTNQISVTSLYRVAAPAHSAGGHLSRLPLKQMAMVAALFWALAAASLIVTSRLERVVRHPAQLTAALGLDVAAVTLPLPAPTVDSLSLPPHVRGAGA